MKRSPRRRAYSVLATALLAVVALEVPALAAPPANNSIASATPLGAPPARFDVDTRQATASPTDGSCVHGRSVWFRTRPGVTRTVRLSTIGSDYDTVLAVFRGTRTNRTRIACADDSFEDGDAAATQVRFVAGKTYWVAASACCSRSAPGGQLVLNTFLPTATGLTASVVSVETGAISGRLLVRGTARCTTPSELELELSASQRVGGANVASGEGYSSDLCGRQSSNWTATLDSFTGWAFQPGTASVTLSAFASDGFGFADMEPHTDNYVVTGNPNARAR
jgi:hypothetical protein